MRTAGDMDARAHQRAKFERLQSLIKKVGQLRSKGMGAKANVMTLEIRKLEKELGLKTRWRETKAERVADINEWKKSIRERLKK